MIGTRGESSSVNDATVASFGWDVNIGRGICGQPRQNFLDEQDAVATVLWWKYRDFAERCVGRFNQQSFAGKAFDENKLVVYLRNCRVRDTAIVSYVYWWKVLGNTFSGIFFGLENVDMLFLRHRNVVEYVRILSDSLQKGTDIGTLHLARCYLCKPFVSFFLAQKAEEYERELDLEVLQETKDHWFFLGWHNLEFFRCTACKALSVLCAYVCVLERDW